jgi:hypothetical protein
VLAGAVFSLVIALAVPAIAEADTFRVTKRGRDLVRKKPRIGRLKRNGGPTKTVALKQGSPAIGKAHRPSAPDRDQRGRKRGNQPDIGAFER